MATVETGIDAKQSGRRGLNRYSDTVAERYSHDPQLADAKIAALGRAISDARVAVEKVIGDSVEAQLPQQPPRKGIPAMTESVILESIQPAVIEATTNHNAPSDVRISSGAQYSDAAWNAYTRIVELKGDFSRRLSDLENGNNLPSGEGLLNGNAALALFADIVHNVMVDLKQQAARKEAGFAPGKS